MEFDENKKLDVEISQNDFVENRISKKRKKKAEVKEESKP